jgi:hypothetical protein
MSNSLTRHLFASVFAGLLFTMSLFGDDLRSPIRLTVTVPGAGPVSNLDAPPFGAADRTGSGLAMADTPVSTPVVEPAPKGRGNPKIASNGRGFLSVGWDKRSDSTEIRAARLDDSGALVDETGFRVASDALPEFLSVASDGNDYVVAYNCPPRAVCLARIDAESARVDPGSRLENATYPALASTGNGYLLAYSDTTIDYPQNYAVHDVPLSSDATLTGTPTWLAATNQAPVVAASGSHSFVCWVRKGTLEGRIFGPGAPEKPIQIDWDLKNNVINAAAVASDGTDFLVAWVGPVGGLYSRRVSRDGSMSETRLSESDVMVRDPQMTWTGSSYAVSYISYGPSYRPGRLRRLTVQASGVLLSRAADVFTPADAWWNSAIAGNGSRVVVLGEHVYDETRYTSQHSYYSANQIEASILDANANVSGQRADPFGVSHSVTQQQEAVAARIGPNAVVAWRETVGPNQHGQVFLQRIDENGRPLDGRGSAVGATGPHQYYPALGGSLAAWLESVRPGSAEVAVYVRGLESDGVLSAMPPAVVGAAGLNRESNTLSIGAIGDDHLLVWKSNAGRVVAAHVVRQGEQLTIGPSFELDPGHYGSRPVVATDGSNYFVLWGRTRPCNGICVGTSYTTEGAFVDGRLPVAGPVANISAPPQRGSRPYSESHVLEWRGSEYVASWLEYRNSMEMYEALMVRRIDKNGTTIGDAVTLAPDSNPESLEWDGRNLFLVYNGEGRKISRLTGDLELSGTTNLATGPVRSLLARENGELLAIHEKRADDDIWRLFATQFSPQRPRTRPTRR